MPTLWGSLAFMFVSLLVYGYLVNQTVHNVVERRSLMSDMTRLQSEVSDLEAKYIEGRASVTYEDARALGFTEPLAVDYVTAGDGIDVALLTR